MSHMTLSSTSRQQRKSMLPKPRSSSRISATSTTSRIARRVPSPLLVAISYNDLNNNNSNSSSITSTTASGTQATVQVCAATNAHCNLTLQPEAGLQRAGSPLRLPWLPAGISSDSYPTPDPDLADRSETSCESSLMSHTPSLSPELKKRTAVGINTQYPTPPASAEVIKQKRFFKEQPVQDTPPPVVVAGAPAPPHARRPSSRRPASVSTALSLSTNTVYRVDNASTRDASGGGIQARKTWKKSVIMNSSGKENRRPRMNTRVPPPSVTTSAPTIPSCSTRRTVVAQPPPSRAASFLERPSPSRPLVIRKQPPLAAVAGSASSSPVISASDASGALPVLGPVSAGVPTLIGDVDRFAKEWTEMFDELSAGAEDLEDRLAFNRTRLNNGQPGNAEPLQDETPENPAAVAGDKVPRKQPGLPGSTASMSILQESTLAGTNAETDQFGMTPMSLTRWQHRERNLVKDTSENRPESDIPSASTTDPQTDKVHHLLQKALLRNAPLQTIPQALRHLPSLPEVSPTIPGSHLVETTSVVLSNHKDQAVNLPQSTSSPPRLVDIARRNGILQQARCYSPATVPNLSSSPLSNVTSLSAVSSLYPSSPLMNLRPNDVATNDPAAALPSRSPSLRGLRAIFKRTSAGLTGSHRQRAESLKERIGEPRVLSLGSISITNLRDAGVVSGCAMPI